MRPNIDRINRAIAEGVEADSSVFGDRGEFVRGAEEIGLPLVGVEGPDADEGLFVLNLNAPRQRIAVRLRKASIYGINFKIFGVGYPWYPGEDRVSFVFLHCPEVLADGRIVDIFHRDELPGLIRFDTIRGSDWYASSADIHLREELYLGWFDRFFAWVKFFHPEPALVELRGPAPAMTGCGREFAAIQAQVALRSPEPRSSMTSSRRS